jgi:hypothetical protein
VLSLRGKHQQQALTDENSNSRMTAESLEATIAAEATADTPADRQAETVIQPAATAGDATATAKGAGQHRRFHFAATSKDMCTIRTRDRDVLSMIRITVTTVTVSLMPRTTGNDDCFTQS